MLETILLKSDEVDITDELHLFCPRWLRRDLATNIDIHVGPLDRPGALNKLLDLLYSGIPFGWLWSAADKVLDRDMMLAELSDRQLDLRTVFDAILVVHARMRNKTRIGAKFPVHYSYAKQLLKWYPDCLLVHTTRNPKAVYASQAAKYLDADDNWLKRQFLRLRQFVHINIQISWTAKIHKELNGLPNYRLVRYEDIVQDPETHIPELCRFLDIKFDHSMLVPQRFGSSFGNGKAEKQGFDKSSIERWRSEISPFAAKAIDIFHRRAYSLLGYDRRARDAGVRLEH